MFQKIKIATLILFSIFVTILHAEDIPFQLPYSESEYQFGQTLSIFMNELAQNRFSQKHLHAMLAMQKKAPAFAELNKSIERIKLIGEIANQDSFYASCTANIPGNKDFAENLEERINLNLDRYCRYLYLNRLARLSPSINFSTRDLKFLRDSTSFYIAGENQAELILFYKNFKSNLIESEKISKILQQKFIDSKVRPPSPLLIQMHISPQFNSFLQQNINLDDKSTMVFQKEFQRTTREAFNAIEKGNYEQAVQLARNNLIFYNNNKNFISDEKAWLGITQIAKDLYHKGREDESRELFNAAKSIASQNKQQESLYNLIWPTVINKDDKALWLAIQKYDLEKSFDTFDSKLQYWIAYAFYKNGQRKKSTDLFNKIVSSTPYSFYSILALKMLALDENGKMSERALMSKLVSKNPLVDYAMIHVGTTVTHALKRLAIWQKIDNDRFVKNEVRYIRSLDKNDVFQNPKFAEKVSAVQCKDFLTLNLVRLLNSKNQFLSSFKIFQDSLDQNSLALNFTLIRYIFPLTYIDIIKRYARNVDPLVIISLVRQESSFNPNANSAVGALGLMQLMPATAKRYSPRVRAKHLVNPQINLGIGIKYFRDLLARYDGNLIFALAAYNAGESRIDRWRKEIFRCEDPLAQIEAIPYEETRNYVKLIYRNYFFYSMLGEKSILMTPIQDSFKISLKH